MFCSLIAALAISSASALSVSSKLDKFCKLSVVESGTLNSWSFIGPNSADDMKTPSKPTTIPFYSTKLTGKASCDVTVETSPGPVAGSRLASSVFKYQDGDKTATVIASYDPAKGITTSYSDFDNVKKVADSVAVDSPSCSDFDCDASPISIANGAVQILNVKHDLDENASVYIKTEEGVFMFVRYKDIGLTQLVEESEIPKGADTFITTSFQGNDAYVKHQVKGAVSGYCVEAP